MFGSRTLELSRVAQIAVLRGRATDLMLFDENDCLLVKLGGSLQDFDELLGELKMHTQSPQVTLFKWGQWDCRLPVNQCKTKLEVAGSF